MTFSLTAILPLRDMLALGWFFLCWVGYAWYADHRRWGTRELASVLHDYRLRWMRRVLERENRIADTVVLQTVMRSDNRVCYLVTRKPHKWIDLGFRIPHSLSSLTPLGLRRQVTQLTRLIAEAAARQVSTG